ncbi:ABC transporter substrate-binding protein [Salinarchaeum chitinilyticum]
MRGAAAVGAAGTTLFAGCLTGGDGGSNALEVMHGWNAGDGQEAFDALTSAFTEEYPDIDTNWNGIGSSGNTSLNQQVANRFQSDDPPSSFAGWPGENLMQYEGRLGDIEEDVWNQANLKEAHYPEVVEACQGPNGFNAVPIGSHRMNDVFYNVQVLEDAGVDPDSIDSFEAWTSAMDTIQSETNATPYVNAMAPWIVLQFWAVNMLGSQGYDAYMNFIEGNGDREQVLAAFENAQVVLSEYINDDAPEIDFTTANQRLMEGDAAFTHQGNWSAGAYANADLTYGEDWGAIRFPGTEDMYGFHLDSFIYPNNNPTPEDSKTFLRFVGSEQAQIAFNQYKGSIPTQETSTDQFNDYLVETIEDFGSVEYRPPTIAHGLAVPAGVLSELKTAISQNFADPFDAESATDRFMELV